MKVFLPYFSRYMPTKGAEASPQHSKDLLNEKVMLHKHDGDHDFGYGVVVLFDVSGKNDFCVDEHELY